MASYVAALNQTVQVTTNTENNTITAPPNPQTGHWFGVKMLTPTGVAAGSRNLTTVLANTGQQIEDVDGKGPQASTIIGFNYEGSRWLFIDSDPPGNGVWWRTESRPLTIPELWDKDVGSLLLGTDTPIPVVNDASLALPVYFQPNAGALECIRPFAGTFHTRIYFEFVLSGNNQDAIGAAELYIVSAAGPNYPVIKQGKGAVASFFGPRSGTFYFSAFNEALVVANVGDIIGLRGSSDIAQAGDTYVIEDTGIFVWPI